MSEPSDTERHPNPVDLHVGARIRMRRKILGVSQERLAEDLGLTFQQIQKYETGQVTLSVARLITLAQVLDAPVGDLLSGLGAHIAAEHPAGKSNKWHPA